MKQIFFLVFVSSIGNTISQTEINKRDSSYSYETDVDHYFHKSKYGKHSYDLHSARRGYPYKSGYSQDSYESDYRPISSGYSSSYGSNSNYNSHSLSSSAGYSSGAKGYGRKGNKNIFGYSIESDEDYSSENQRYKTIYRPPQKGYGHNIHGKGVTGYVSTYGGNNGHNKVGSNYGTHPGKIPGFVSPIHGHNIGYKPDNSNEHSLEYGSNNYGGYKKPHHVIHGASYGINKRPISVGHGIYPVPNGHIIPGHNGVSQTGGYTAPSAGNYESHKYGGNFGKIPSSYSQSSSGGHTINPGGYGGLGLSALVGQSNNFQGSSGIYGHSIPGSSYNNFHNSVLNPYGGHIGAGGGSSYGSSSYGVPNGYPFG